MTCMSLSFRRRLGVLYDLDHPPTQLRRLLESRREEVYSPESAMPVFLPINVKKEFHSPAVS